MKKIFILLLTISSISFAQSKKEIILFQNNQFILTNEAKAKLDNLISTTPINQLNSIALSGNTDSDGDSNYNLALSEKRVNEVMNYLVLKGISKEIIKINFVGENNPIAENGDENGKQKNRRVELVFNFKSKNIENTIFKKTSKESQYFSGKSNEIITITGKEGTIISIPKNVLVKKNGKYALGKIEFELKEFYKKSDIILSNLHSMSDNKLLETGGMIYLKATSNGEELALKKGSNVTITFSSKNNPIDMEVFYGQPQNDNSVNWINNKKIKSQSSDNFKSILVYTSQGDKDSLSTEYDKIDSDIKLKELGEEYEKIATIDNTILKSGQLGWINCDQFYKVKDKTTLYVDIDMALNPEIRLIFKDINSIMQGYVNHERKLIFENIPIGKKATVIAFSYAENETYFTMKEVVLEKKSRIKLELEKTSMEKLQQELQKIN